MSALQLNNFAVVKLKSKLCMQKYTFFGKSVFGQKIFFDDRFD